MPSPSESSDRLPVLIAGAGPCGLVAALTLQQENIPFIIIERASREKLCANVGSGYDLNPTAMGILQHRLGLNVDTIFSTYTGMCVQDMKGNLLRDIDMSSFLLKFGSVDRSGLQNLLLKSIFPAPDKEEGVLCCGAGVQSYTTTKSSPGATTVTAMLSDGREIQGRALLGCDGIHSAVRKHMKRDICDELNFCKVTCFWGKCEVLRGSELDRVIRETQTHAESSGSSAVVVMGSREYPGSFFAVPHNGELLWILSFQADDPPGKQSDDLTRRGGRVFDDEAKQQLLERMGGRGDIIRLCIQATLTSDIIEAGLFDRKDNTLSYVDEDMHVALMGDSAHPQSPFMGQGCNMAIVDAYVVATRISRQASIPEALRHYDSDISRKKTVREVIEKSRFQGNVSVSSSGWTCWILKTVMKNLPMKWLIGDVVAGDRSNHDFVHLLDRDFPDLKRHDPKQCV